MLPRLSTLAQVNRLTPPAVLLIGDHTHSADEAVVAAVTAAAKLPAYFVHFATADQALLDKFSVTSLPHVVFLKAQWCAMVLGVQRHEVETMCTWATTDRA